LGKTGCHPKALIDKEDIGELRVFGGSEQTVGIGKATAKDASKGKVAAGAGFVLKNIAHGKENGRAELQAMTSTRPGESVVILIEHRHLLLGQKIRRAEKSLVGEGGQWYAPANCGIVRNPGQEVARGLRQSERLLLRLRKVADPAETEVIDH